MSLPEQRDPESTRSYTVAWICALEEEYFCACRMLDEEFDGPEISEDNDDNTYVYGRIAKHYLVIGCLPAGRYGTNSAARVVRDMVRTFPRLRFALMVGIAGGAPTTRNDIRLGDVVVSQPKDGFGGVIQYDLGKLKDGLFHKTGQLNAPPEKILGVIPEMRRLYSDKKKPDRLAEHLQLLDDMEDYQQPTIDRLYATYYPHVDGQNCDECDSQSVVVRPERQNHRALYVHYGNIASGNSVLKDAVVRDTYANDPELNILCFEMEAAGLMNNVPCLIIRGICDYCDSHKNDDWHKYAALAAAAYARELLLVLKPQRVDSLPPWAERVAQEIQQVGQNLSSLNKTQKTLLTTVKNLDQKISLGKLEGVMEAGFDSFSNRDEVQCLHGTRTELLQQIMEWAMSPSQPSIFWLKGMAGTGKSTISRTVAKSLKDINHLGANFFFKRGEGDRGNAKKLFPTLTRQLVLVIPRLDVGVNKTLHDNPDIMSKSLSEQFEKLLLQPLLNLDPLGRQPQIAVIVIDALDECEYDQDVRNIIRLLSLLQKTKSIRLRIFLTSRPELPIRLGFSDIADHEYRDLALYEIPEEVTEHDIQLFLQDRFVKIKHDRNISQDWPGDDVIQELVTISVPLFISAATICRYIEHSQWEPKLRLTELLTNQAKYVSRLDKTYLPILERLLADQESDESEQQQLLQEYQAIVGVIILLAVPLSINALSLFLGIGADQISNRLDSFRSVLSIPVERDQPVRILHLSFRDFLVQSRTEFLIDEPRKHKEIAHLCLKTMRGRLQKDICKLGSPGRRRTDIDVQSLRQHLPSELEYSCRYWVHHLKKSPVSSADTELVLLFLHEHLLHWVEAMSLLGLVSELVRILNLLQEIETGDLHSEISQFLHDAKRFILKNSQIADDAPLQLYCSGLTFAPRMTITRRKFEEELPSWICKLPEVTDTWSAELQTLEGHSDPIQSVTFSPDGRLLASGSDDKTIRLWDTATGALQHKFEGHLDPIQSVTFSPDGRLIASGSRDKTIRLWDTVTGALQQTFENQSVWVWSVAFSPDGLLLVSGSDDKLVRLWNTVTGTLQETLGGHLGPVQSVIFSPNGQLLASASSDKTVRLWDTIIGAVLQYLEGHTQPVQSVAFSPNGRLIASGSRDKTVRLWDTVTGAVLHILEGHSLPVRSVAFSPDGRLIASGSWDKIVQLWDTATGVRQQTLEGHSQPVRSVSFSPDGRLIASGSWDKMIRLWDITVGRQQQIRESHFDSVWSIAFSPDGQVVASGSRDKTVRLWDATTGALQQTFEGHSCPVPSVIFSPDGRFLASGSDDKTIRLWDTATGSPQQIFEGHSDPVQSVTFSPNGRLLASGSDDKTIRLWDTATGALQQTLEGHSDPVQLVTFSPDGRLLASGSDDKTIRLWDTATGAPQLILTAEEQVTDLKFTEDGSHLRTNFGPLDIQSGRENHTLRLANAEMITLDGQWINLHGKRVLWLPPEYRPRCSATKDSTLALGHASGRISLIEFCT